ncbi:MAG: ABC transporter ATP-binding protein [Pseudonocardiaceae bacterium]
MIEVRELTKDYGDERAVNRLSFTALPGVVTGVLGPKGAGKSTTMRLILGLDAPRSGTALVNGQRCATIDRPLHTVGALLDTDTMHGGDFSTGMRQRLGVAGALLDDPGVLLFDEPMNGLDQEGIRWIRGLMRSLAAQGRTVFVSSKHMSEMELTADEMLVIRRGKLITETSTREPTERLARDVFVRSPRIGG